MDAVMNYFTDQYAARLSEGISFKDGQFVIDMVRDYKHNDLVLLRTPSFVDNVFCSFTVNRRSDDKSHLTELKLILKHLEVEKARGPWEAMMEYAVKTFTNAVPIQSFDVIVTPHGPGGGAPPLANVMVADLEELIRPDARIIRKGVAKSSTSGQVYLDYDMIRATAPKKYSIEELEHSTQTVEKNFDSALKRAEKEGRFQLRHMLPQFRKYVRGMFNVNCDIKPGEKVLFVDDLYTTGSTLRQIRALLPDNDVYGWMLLKG
jgi:hypothetical protein